MAGCSRNRGGGGLAVSPAVSDVIRRASALSHGGHLDEAAALLRSAMEAEPMEPELVMALAGVLEKNGDYLKALVLLEKSVKKFPDDYEMQEELSAVQLRLKRYRDSAATASRILKTARKIPGISRDVQDRAMANIAAAYGKEREDHFLAAKFAEVLSYVEEALKEDPGSETLQSQKAGLLRAAGEFDGAVKAYRSIRESEPDNLFVSLQVARTLMEKDDHKAALEELEKAAKASPGNFRAYRNLGWYWLEMGKAGEGSESLEMLNMAVDHFKTAEKLSPLPIDVSFNRMKAATALYHRWKKTNDAGDRKRALEAFDAYKRDAPPWTSTDAARAYVEDLEGKSAPGGVKREEEELELSPVVR